MIKEAYVSFEVAKLLKEKGFNEPIRCWYDNFQDFHEEGVRMSNSDCLPPTIMCPTQAMAMAWLRKVHNIFIEPRAGETDGKTWYDFDIIPINGREIVWNHYNYIPLVECNSYEEALEVALRYTLENLI